MVSKVCFGFYCFLEIFFVVVDLGEYFGMYKVLNILGIVSLMFKFYFLVGVG